MLHSADKEWQLIEPIVEDMGYELVGVDYRKNGETGLLCVYIDHENGVNVDDCAKISHQISAIMDVEDPIKEHYTLEVSSPGLDRPLFKEADFKRFAGQRVKVKLGIPFDGRRNFNGILNGVEDSMVLVVVDNEEFMLPIEHIDKANIIPQFKKGKKK